MSGLNIFDADDGISSILQLLNPRESKKTTASHYKKILGKLSGLLQERFQAQTDVRELISLNTRIIDELLKNIWELHKFPDHSAVLIAIGGDRKSVV